MRAARPASRGASIPDRGDRLGDKGNGVEPFRCLADPAGDLVCGDALAKELAGAAVAAARGEDRRRQVANARQAGERLDARPARDSVGDALVPDARGGDAGGVQAVRLGGGGREGRGVLRHSRHLDPDHVVGSLAHETGAVEDLAELNAEVGVGRPRTSAAMPAAASRACAGPPRQAIARARTRSET